MCWSCKEEQIFDTSFDEDCNRCSGCGSLPYSRKEWVRKKMALALEQIHIQKKEAKDKIRA